MPAVAGDRLTPLDLREVKVSDEIGRRIAITISYNLLMLDPDRDFLRPFGEEPRKGGYIGLGKTLEAMVRFAAYTVDVRVDPLPKHFIAEIIKAQAADGYIGTLPPDRRIKGLWDVHEMGCVIWALPADYQYFGDAHALAAARKAADYLLKHWSGLPPDRGSDAEEALHAAFTGIERTMLALHRATGERTYLDFVTRTRASP